MCVCVCVKRKKNKGYNTIPTHHTFVGTEVKHKEYKVASAEASLRDQNPYTASFGEENKNYYQGKKRKNLVIHQINFHSITLTLIGAARFLMCCNTNNTYLV